MPEQMPPNAVDVAVTIIVVGALVIGLISMFAGRVIAWWQEGVEKAEQRRRVRHLPYRAPAVMSRSVDNEPDEGPEPEPRRSSAEPHMNHAEPGSFGSTNPAELVLNAEEIAATARMIEHKTTATKPTKSSTIQAGFGVSRGGSALYVRASLIYDALFGVPPPAVPPKFKPDPEVEAWRQKMNLPIRR